MKENGNRERIKNILLIALCVLLAGGVFLYNFFGRGKKSGEKEEEKEPEEIDFVLPEENEGILSARAKWLLSKLVPGWEEGLSEKTKEELEEKNLTCQMFRDFLYTFCDHTKLDYHGIVSVLPERLLQVKETDELYLSEFLSIYEQLLGMLTERASEGEKGGLPEYRDCYVLLIEGKKLYDAKGKTYRYENCEDYSAIFVKDLEIYPKKDPIAEKLFGKPAHRAVSEYKDRVVRALCLGDEMLYIREMLNEEVQIPNVWVISAKESKVLAFVHGYEVEYKTILPLAQAFENMVCDFLVKNGEILQITVKKDVVQGKVLLTSDREIELAGYGRLPLSEDFRIYKIYGDLAMERTNQILVGYSITDFVVENGKVCAALIKEKLKADTIRVLINTSGYKSYYHESVVLTADREFTVTRGEKVQKCKAGEEFSLTFKKEKGSTERVCVETVGGEGKIILRSVKRSYGAPAYRGRMEIVADKEGLLVVNELSMEEYLYAVIPSEMPTSYGDEALKVQAVCARSYAFNQLMASRFRSYGAHVDDSVSSQVYNNVEENEASILAVKETYGLVAALDGDVITAYYYSTSCGHTASYHEVWENASSLSYLTGYLQNEQKEEVDFSVEEEFRKFILSEEIKTYDSGFSWYRWKVTLPLEQFTRQLQKATGLDTVEKVEVTERGKSGIALEVSVTGTRADGEEKGKETVPIRYQTAIRTAFAPGETPLIRKDGSEVKNMTLLPSAFIVIDEEKEDGKLTALTLSGGGYGHGTGMSQNGVKGMVESGKNYEEILAHYYTGTELIFLY